jgi:hypothetical protein
MGITPTVFLKEKTRSFGCGFFNAKGGDYPNGFGSVSPGVQKCARFQKRVCKMAFTAVRPAGYNTDRNQENRRNQKWQSELMNSIKSVFWP